MAAMVTCRLHANMALLTTKAASKPMLAARGKDAKGGSSGSGSGGVRDGGGGGGGGGGAQGIAEASGSSWDVIGPSMDCALQGLQDLLNAAGAAAAAAAVSNFSRTAIDTEGGRAGGGATTAAKAQEGAPGGGAVLSAGDVAWACSYLGSVGKCVCVCACAG